MSTPGERLRADRKKAGLSAEDLGRRASMVMGRDKPMSASAVRNQENGTNGIQPKVAEAYAKVLKTQPHRYLVSEIAISGSSDVQPTGRQLRVVPVVGDVRAGVFQAVPIDLDNQDELEVEDSVSVDLPQFDRAHLVAYRVVGRSMDREYPEGTRVVVCPSAEIGIREGDHVIVSRPGRGGAELTIKEVVIEPGDVIALWPRSTDPAYQQPIRIKPNAEADSGPHIIGVVVASQRIRPAQQGPLIRVGEDD